MGYTFDKFIAEEEFDLVTNAHKSEALLYAMVLPRDLMKKYSDITGYSDEKYKLLYGKHPEDYDSITEKFDYSNSDYKKVCNLRALNSCTSFEYTDNGFKAVYNNKKGDDNLLFFSVPYSDGFTATVNGKAADVALWLLRFQRGKSVTLCSPTKHPDFQQVSKSAFAHSEHF